LRRPVLRECRRRAFNVDERRALAPPCPVLFRFNFGIASGSFSALTRCGGGSFSVLSEQSTMTKQSVEQAATVKTAGATKPKAAPRPKVEKIYIFKVEEDGAGNEVKGEDCGSFPSGYDFERHIRNNLPYGRYRIECRVGGQLPAKWITTFDYVEPLRRVVEDDDDDDLDLETDNAPGVTLADVARVSSEVAAQTIAKVLEATRPAVSSDDIDARVDRIMERRKQERAEMLAEVREEFARLNPTPKRGEREAVTDNDPIMGAVAEIAKSNPALAERVVESVFPTKDEGWMGTLSNAAMNNPQAATQILGGVLAVGQQLFGSFFKRAPTEGAGQAAAAPSETAAPVEQPDPVLVMLEPMRPLVEFIAAELVNNEDYDQTLMAVAQAAERNPQLGLGLAALAQMSSVEVLNTLARFTRQPILLKLKHGAEWVEGLQSQLRGESDDDDAEGDAETPAPVAPVGSSNGTKAHAGVAVQG
jgi:hypothetical protein